LKKGKQLSLEEGRIVLLNFILFSVLIYYISLFIISKWVLHRIDKVMKKFLWVGVASSLTHKYYLIRWDIICRAKEHNGWGALNIK
jgi:hypothetical protein